MSHGRAGGLGRGRSAPQDLLVELARLGFGLDAELPSKRVDTALVLPEGSVTPAVAHVESHQGAVDRLLERIQRQQAERRRTASDASDFVWWASNLARASRANSRSRSRSAANHSSNGASVIPRPSSRSPRYRSTACWRASGSALRASRWNARTST